MAEARAVGAHRMPARRAIATSASAAIHVAARQPSTTPRLMSVSRIMVLIVPRRPLGRRVLGQRGQVGHVHACLLYTSDAADDLLCVDLGGRRIIKKKK